MRRLLLWLTLPVVWFLLLGFALTVLPHVPAWALLVGAFVYVGVVLRRRQGAGPDSPADPTAARFSPFHGGGY